LDKLVRLYDIFTGQLLYTFQGHKDSVYSVAFSPSGTSIISGSLDMTVKVWDLPSKLIDYLSKPLPPSSSSSSSSSSTSISINPIESGNILSPDGSKIKGWNGIWYDSFDIHSVGSSNNSSCRATLSGHRDFVLSVSWGGGVASSSSRKEYRHRHSNGSSSFNSSSGGNNTSNSHQGGGLNQQQQQLQQQGLDHGWVISGSKDRTVTFWGGLGGNSNGGVISANAIAEFVVQGHKNSGMFLYITPIIDYFVIVSLVNLKLKNIFFFFFPQFTPFFKKK